MAGFKLIETYLSSGSDDDDCNQTQKSTIPSESFILNDNQYNESERKQLLPLPECFASCVNKKYDTDEIASMPNDNDADKHQGRIRSFKHERGNWATLVYIKYSPNELLVKWMSSTIEMLPIKGNLIIGESHISLTRTLILKFHWIESFVESLKKICRGIDKFTLDLMNVKLYCNEERTRTFIGIECQCFDQSFEYFTTLLDKLLGEYELPSFYQDASYHISFFWTLGDKEIELKPFISLLNDSLHSVLSQNLKYNSILISELQCKIGNKIYTLSLK